MIVGPGADFHMPIRKITPITTEQMAGLKDDTLAIYVFGKIEYVDSFDKTRVTKFCLQEADVSGGTGLKHANIGNEVN